jgi:hypothetical protein
MIFIIPPAFFGIYAISKHGLKSTTIGSLFISGFSIYALVKIGLYSSDTAINALNKVVFEKYKDEVQHSKYRGVKLTN